jgi:hypothetical protein
MKNFKDYLPEGVKRENRIQASYSNKQKELSALNRGDHSSVPKNKESSEFLFPGMDKEVNIHHNERVNARKNELSTDIESLKGSLSSAKAKNQRRLSNKTQTEKTPVPVVSKVTPTQKSTQSQTPRTFASNWVPPPTDVYGFPLRYLDDYRDNDR